LAYTLWQLGRHPEMQGGCGEAAAVGDRELAPDDVANLGYTAGTARRATVPAGCGIGPVGHEDIDVDGYRCGRARWWSSGLCDPSGPSAVGHRGVRSDRFRPEVAKSIDRWQFLPFGGATDLRG
jgi:hypothetical protein